jgi:replicative DNA helicase
MVVKDNKRPMRVVEQSMPWSPEIEQNILGSILWDCARTIAVCLEKEVSPSWFYLKNHALVYQICLNLYHQGKAVDHTLLATHLQQTGQLDQIGGMNFLADLMEICTSVYLPDWIDKLYDDYKRRQGIILSQELAADLYNPNVDVDDRLDQLSTEFYKLKLRSDGMGELKAMPELAAQAYQEWSSEAVAYPLTGLRQIDAFTGGFVPGYWIVAGRPSMGKSHFGLHLAYEMARQNQNVLFLSSEMSDKQLTNRLVSKISGIPLDNIIKRRFTEQTWNILGEALSQVSLLPLYILDKYNPSLALIKQKIEQIARETGNPPRLIVVDYIQKYNWGGANKNSDLEAVSAALFKLHRDYNCNVVALAQIGRSVEGRNDKRPTMSDIKDCGGIEQDADVIFGLYRDEYYDSQTSWRGTTEILALKNRNGPVGRFRVISDLAYGRYFDMDLKADNDNF